MTNNSWKISHDPLGLLDVQPNLEPLEKSARVQGEDLLQATRVGPGKARQTLDLGWYHDRYLVYLVENENWDTPTCKIESLDLRGAWAAFRGLMA
jgi:hypothetical protein